MATTKAKIVAQAFLKYLNDRGEEGLLDQIVDILEQESKSRSEHVRVITAISLTSVQKKAAEKLAHTLTKTKAQVTFEEDASLIDGIKIYHKDIVWNYSLADSFEEIVNSTS